MTDSTERFTNRVENYIKYRPDYPSKAINYIISTSNIANESVIADIGSGTGILTNKFLDKGIICYGVEPNATMRKAAEQYLQDYSNFVSFNGTAENTSLTSSTIDLITAGQAFHWFNHKKAKIEFQRALKPGGMVCLIWNSRRKDTPFLKEYDDVITQYSMDYTQINHQADHNQDPIQKFFEDSSNYQTQNFSNEQVFTFEGLKGRLLSSSYAPTKNHSNYKPLITALQILFDTYQEDNNVQILYKTEVFMGTLE